MNTSYIVFLVKLGEIHKFSILVEMKQFTQLTILPSFTNVQIIKTLLLRHGAVIDHLI